MYYVEFKLSIDGNWHRCATIHSFRIAAVEAMQISMRQNPKTEFRITEVPL